MAKGAKNIKTCIITYRREYEKTRLSKETLIILFIKPSKEKILNSLFSGEIFELITEINSEKEIVFPNK